MFRCGFFTPKNLHQLLGKSKTEQGIIHYVMQVISLSGIVLLVTGVIGLLFVYCCYIIVNMLQMKIGSKLTTV